MCIRDRIQGIGAGFVPKALNTEVYDEVFPVENEDAFTVGKLIAKHEGILEMCIRDRDTVLAVSSPDILFSAVTLQQVMESLLLSW